MRRAVLVVALLFGCTTRPTSRDSGFADAIVIGGDDAADASDARLDADSDALDAPDGPDAFDASPDVLDAGDVGEDAPYTRPDGAPGGPCDAGCPPRTVCCPPTLGCAGSCAPDCRLGEPCPGNFHCDFGSGVCTPN